MATYRDNYPHNIEAPQRVYVQYSQDIDFDYSNGKYPLGETHEGFVWENIYYPLQHTVGVETLGKHVWMRWKIGEKESWTAPMRLTDSFLNIETTDTEVIQGTSNVKFRFKYTLTTGEIIYSEYITLSNGINGRGIQSLDIIGGNLQVTYTDNTTANLGRVVGYDGTGIPVGAADYSYLTTFSNVPTWRPPLDLFNDMLSAVSPILYADGEFSHAVTDGNRHIPIGGTDGYVLSTDGSGNYTWVRRLEFFDIDDFSGTGDTDKLWSADKISTMFASIQSFGIKYSVALISDLGGIVLPDEGDLAVVNEDRFVYRFNGSIWVQFFALDVAHNHDDRYYTETELSTSLGGGVVHWDNISSKPTFFTSFMIDAPTGSFDVFDGDTISLIATGNISIEADVSKNLWITVPAYTEGTGIDIAANVISHEDTSTVVDTNNNLGGTVVRNLTFDGLGHVTGHSSYNLDLRYSLLGHTHDAIGNWTYPTLNSGWYLNGGIGNDKRIRYRLENGQIVLNGIVAYSTLGTDVIFTLPLTFRPGTYMYFTLISYAKNPYVLEIAPSGTVSVFNRALGDAGLDLYINARFIYESIV